MPTGHVLEPLDTWQKYIDPQYRDRAVRLEHDDNGWEVLMFDNKPLNVIRGALGALGGVGLGPRRGRSLFSHRVSARMRTAARRGSYDPVPRLRVMDSEGIDISLLYPTVGIAWEGWGHRSEARHRLHSGPITAGSSISAARIKKRLYPVAHISLIDPDGAADEVVWARKQGCVGVFLSPDMVARGWKHFNDPAFVRFWETVQDLEMPVGFHVVLRDEPSWRDWIQGEGDFGLFNFAFLAIDVMAASFTQMISPGACSSYIPAAQVYGPGVRRQLDFGLAGPDGP